MTTTLALDLYLAEDTDGHMPYRGETPARFRKAGDTLHVDPDPDNEYDLTAQDTAAAAMNIAYRLANIGDAGDPNCGAWVQTYRGRDRARSLSVGDVIVVNGEVGYRVDSFGHSLVDAETAAILAASR